MILADQADALAPRGIAGFIEGVGFFAAAGVVVECSCRGHEGEPPVTQTEADLPNS